MSQSNYYNRIASIYDQTRWMTDGVAEEIADFIVELVGATADTSFLEPGVGTGLNVMSLVRRGYAVTGMDISQEMLEQFRQKLRDSSEQVGPEQVGCDQAESKNLTLIQGDASELPFADNYFDVVLTVHMIHAVADWQHFLDEVGRVMLGFYRSRAYGFCWRVADEVFEQIMDDFEEVCVDHYGSLDAELSSTATFELWDFRL